MAERIDWDECYRDFAAVWEQRARDTPLKPIEPAATILERLGTPAPEDERWLIEALGDRARKWFVAWAAGRADVLSESLFRPMLDTAIDEVNPSANRSFIEPCMHAFGPRRVNRYLLSVVQSGTDSRKAGAVNALYWAQVPLTFVGLPPEWTIEYATPESRAANEALADLQELKRKLLLATFVSNENLHVRRSIIPQLSLDPAHHAPSDRPLVAQAIAIGRGHPDTYIRERTEVQLGNSSLLPPLPEREPEPPAAP